MKINKKKKSIYEPQDDYEKQLMKDIENDVFVPVPNQKEEIAKAILYAKNTLKKDKRVTLRVAKEDLEKIQSKALATGVPYQTIIGALIRQYANGKITVGL
ncbi:antitoxin [Candidatus Roizmanbacteria bacterium]|nr:antitoxin [Candidatus Roizmanbacteria bacterium]